MAEELITYSKAADTANGTLNEGELHDEIDADAGIGPAVARVGQADTSTDPFDVVMASPLSAPERTALDAVVAAHDGTVSPRALGSRAMQSTEADINGELDEEVAAWDWFLRIGDTALDIEATVMAGSFGIRIDADVSDRAILTPTVSAATIDITAVSRGRHKLRFFARTAGSQMTLLEVHTSKL